VGAAEGAVAKAAQPRDDGRAAAGRRGDRARWKPQQVVFFIRDHATLVSGDVLSGTGGRLHVSVDDADAERLLPALDAIANLPIEQLIIPHGDAVRTDGAALLRAAVWEARRAY
jgi:glyoxylase-like metal-dependent hydrolase (beta-lactamase superfamily II)